MSMNRFKVAPKKKDQASKLIAPQVAHRWPSRIINCSSLLFKSEFIQISICRSGVPEVNGAKQSISKLS